MFYQVTAENRQRIDYRAWVECANEDQDRCRGRLGMTFLDSNSGRVGHRNVQAHEPPFRNTVSASWRARGDDTYTLRLECDRCGESGPIDYVILTRPADWPRGRRAARPSG